MSMPTEPGERGRAPLEDPHLQDLHPDEELVPEDDRVIGTAFRWSLLVILGIAALVALVAFLLRRDTEVEEAVEVAMEAPRQVTETAEAPAVTFTDIAGRAGLDYTHFNGARGEKLLPETMGGGGGFVDVDGDGDPQRQRLGGEDEADPGEEERAEVQGEQHQALGALQRAPDVVQGDLQGLSDGFHAGRPITDAGA
jgi:hypothetical protein